MHGLVEELCSRRCAGRAAGSAGGRVARALIVAELRRAGLDPFEQPVPGCRGANVLATIPGDVDRWVIVGAHHDHLGVQGGRIYRGADDNAAAVAILVELAGRLARERPAGRGVLVAAFDGEEPPHFASDAMGSQRYALQPAVPLERTDLFVCMDLVGHALGEPGMPDAVRQTVFLLGAERSSGTGAEVDALATAEPGLFVRRADAEIIPPLSDHGAFWERRIPFAFLTCARSRIYHTPDDTPEHLDFAKMASTARWLERFVRASCARDTEAVFRDARDDASTVRAMLALCDALAPSSPAAAAGGQLCRSLLAACDRDGRLPAPRTAELAMLVSGLEQGLA